LRAESCFFYDERRLAISPVVGDAFYSGYLMLAIMGVVGAIIILDMLWDRAWFMMLCFWMMAQWSIKGDLSIWAPPAKF
jgi:hypothetical protein